MLLKRLTIKIPTHSCSVLMRKTLHWKYCYKFLSTVSRMLFGWKRNESIIHPRQKPQWTCRAEDLGWGLPQSYCVLVSPPPAFLRDVIIAGSHTMRALCTGVLIRMACDHRACPPGVDPKETVSSNFRTRITWACPKCGLHRQGRI